MIASFSLKTQLLVFGALHSPIVINSALKLTNKQDQIVKKTQQNEPLR